MPAQFFIHIRFAHNENIVLSLLTSREYTTDCAKIGVHLKEYVVSEAQTPVKCGKVGRSQPQFSGVFKRMRATGILRDKFFYNVRGTVRRIVVNYKNCRDNAICAAGINIPESGGGGAFDEFLERAAVDTGKPLFITILFLLISGSIFPSWPAGFCI
jgi:hypothetical protein